MAHRTLPVAGLLALLILSLPAGAAAQAGSPELPTISLGDVFSAEMHLTLQTDWSRYAADASEPAAPIFSLQRARLKLEGTLFSRIDYEIERDVRQDANPWADAFADVKVSKALQIRAGRFKMPFGMEYLTGATKLDFVSRALTSDYLTPGRDLGVSVHGSLFAKTLKYDAGLFRAGGDHLRDAERENPSPSPTFAARVVVSPVKPLSFGASMTQGGLAEGLNSLRGHDYADHALFHKVYVSGQRRRLGAELEWDQGPLEVRAERILVADDRLGLGTDDDDLPAAEANGWYVSGLFKFTDWIEGGARLEHVRFGMVDGDSQLSRDQRARSIAADADRVMTFGVNWYPVRGVKLQFNLLREAVEKLGMPVADRTPEWGRVLRLEVAF